MTVFLVVWSALGTAAIILVPLLAPAVLAASIVMPVLLVDRGQLLARLREPRPDTALLLVTCVYLAINATWSLDAKNASMAVGVAVLATAVLHIGAAGFPLMRAQHLSALSRGLVFGLLFGLTLLCFEYVTRMSGQRALEHLLAEANITSVRVQAGTWQLPLNQGMTRNLGIVVLMVWIGAAAQLNAGTAGRRRLITAALLLLAGVSAALSPSATAKIGMIAGTLATLVAFYAPRLVIAAITAIWVVLCTSVVPLAQLLYRLEAYKASWIAPSGRHRLLIWAATSEWYWQAPIFGAGIGSAREMPRMEAPYEAALQELSPTAYLNWHAHNAYLQVWFEAGAVGAILMLLIGLLTIKAIQESDARLKPLLCGAFACFALFIATGFSIWAAWYLSALALSVMAVRLIDAQISARARESS